MENSLLPRLLKSFQTFFRLIGKYKSDFYCQSFTFRVYCQECDLCSSKRKIVATEFPPVRLFKNNYSWFDAKLKPSGFSEEFLFWQRSCFRIISRSERETFSASSKNIFLFKNKKGNGIILKTWSVSFHFFFDMPFRNENGDLICCFCMARVNNLCRRIFVSRAALSCPIVIRYLFLRQTHRLLARLRPSPPNKHFKYSNKINYVLEEGREAKQAKMGTWLQDDPTLLCVTVIGYL